MNIGVLNSGGDSPGLNAVIEGVVGAASRRGWNVVGFYDGFEGLLSEEGDERFEWLTPAACRGLRAKGGTILGTVNKGNFAIKVGVDQKGAIEPAVLEKTKATVRRLGLDALIVVGGDGSQSTALLLSEIGLPVVGVPKTIDNDLGATDVTFGFYSAVSIVSESLDRLETTANAHQRMMVVEVMGRHAGWIALEGGIAGSADVILLPEIPFSLENVVECIKARKAAGQREILVVVSEGARLADELVLLDEKTQGEVRLGGIGKVIAKKLEEATGIETRSCVLGHIQRGGSPTVEDRMKASMLGEKAALALISGVSNVVFGFDAGKVVEINLDDAVHNKKTMDPELVRLARMLV